MLGNAGTHAHNQTLYKTPLYNAATDFAPVALVAEQPIVLVARKDLPADNLQEFIAYAKANQAKMQYGSAGAGSAGHLACALLNAAIGVNVTHVPYRGGGPAMQDLIAGRIDYHVHDHRHRDAADRERPDQGDRDPDRATARRCCRSCATAHEQGLTDFEAATWFALLPAEGHARADHPEAARGHGRDDGHAVGAGAAEGDRRHRGRARSPLARIPAGDSSRARSRRTAVPIKATGVAID